VAAGERHRPHQRHRHLIARAAFAVFALLALPLAAAQDGAARVVALGNAMFDVIQRADPINYGTFVGDDRYDDRLGDQFVPAARARRFAKLHAIERDLLRIDREALPAEARLNYDVVRYHLATRLAFERFPEPFLPIEHMSGVPTTVANFGSGQAEQPLKTVAQYEAYLKRVVAIRAWTNNAIANLRAGLGRGITQPKPIVRSLLPQLRTLANGRVEDNPFYAPVLHFPEAFGAGERARLERAYRRAVSKDAAPAMRRLADFLERDYVPRARETIGMGALPDGLAWYRAQMRDQTTLDLDPEEIHALGLKEVARIQGEMARVAPRLGYDGDVKGFLPWLRAQERFKPFTEEAQVLAAYAAINERIVPKLPSLFGRMPRAPIVIKPEPELTKAVASDHYSLPAEDGSRPGIFWAVVVDPRKYASFGMPALFMHEGQPGHHFQMALQQELALPRFRKYLWINSYGEGWALYAETLGHEMGFYDDPAVYAGELNAEIVRAVRLVVDTGIHAKGWSYERALAYYRDNVGATEDSARRQVERFIAWPGQALGYKLGALRIQELRRRAQERLGERFRLADFHDAVLLEGSLPLAVLERRIDAWIEARARAS